MPLTTIVDAVANVLNQVGGIGKVLAYSRYAASEKERIDSYVSGGVLNWWIGRRESTSAHDRGAGPQNVRNRHVIVIDGYRAVSSSASSEQAHQELAEAVRAALHSQRMLPSGAGWLSTPVQVAQFNTVMFLKSVL